MNLQESGEMYLETIYTLTKERANVRSIDICDYMGFSKPSVSRAMGLLKNGGFILVDKDGYITLTELGAKVAEKIYTRHHILTEFFLWLGVSPDTASGDACKIEHHISDESFDAIRGIMEKHKTEGFLEDKQ